MRPLEGQVPEMKSMAQSDGWWGGKDMAFFLVKTALRWWYWVGTWDRSKGSWDSRVESEELWIRWVTWHVGSQLRIAPVDQLRWGLCWRNQGWPRITGNTGDRIRWKHNSSWCLWMERWRREVRRVTSPGRRGLPFRAVTVRGVTSESVGTLRLLASEKSIKFPAAPESTMALRCFLWLPQASVMERNSPELEGGAMLVIPVTVLPCLNGIKRSFLLDSQELWAGRTEMSRQSVRSRSDGEIRVPPNCIGSGEPWDSGNSSVGTGLKGGVNTNWWLTFFLSDDCLDGPPGR